MLQNSALSDEEIIRKYSSVVYKIAYSITSNTDDAEDVFQTVFMKYIKRHPKFNDEMHQKAWFIRVAINTAKTYVTQAWNKNTVQLCENIEYETNEKIDLDFAIKTLTPKARTIIYLFYYEGYKTDEIASLLKMKPNAVRTALSRSRKELKTILEKEGYNV